MKIGILSYAYPPEPAFIPGSLAEELAERGHEVRVLTGFPVSPTGRVYPGYRQRWGEESTAGGLTVRRVPRFPGHDGSSVRRAASYLSFAASTSMAAPRYLSGIDALYVYDAPATALAAGALLRLIRRVPTVLHVQDVWPRSAVTSPVSAGAAGGRMLFGGLAGTLRRVYQSVSGIAVSAPSMRDLMVCRGADPESIRMVLNWTDERLFGPALPDREARAAIGHRGRCTIMHAGTIGPNQRVETAIRAAATTHSLFDLVLVGSGPQEKQARRLVADLGATNVRFIGQRPTEEMAGLYHAADYQLVLMRDVPVLRGTVPGKLQAAMSSGSPVVASAGGDTAELVEGARAGLSCGPEDWRALADRFALAAAIPSGARTQMGQRARESYLRRMSLRAGVDQIEQMLAEAATSR
ncbi:glycosyltransferase family 4 protein [Plantactinospora sp. KBS50]|uniref:glycosyltransferase family 4 protein n=1 Tax=Plantactinospora sp. KBS50 TaxID=2024580 RepID=UPI000BAAC65E|nr:glycosyltransferase family 4 protein [Plantactinospora sp. KBS50]ASW55140.1 glycosyltransferase WbuB [Plantactinospora sp. KBS50]